MNGDILGLSGIFSSSLLHPFKTAQEQPWRFIFLACFFSAGAIYVNVVDPNSIAQSQKIPSTLAYLLGGFLVGFGTRLSNGCTSGHGICGLARFSKRSLSSVATFMGTGILTTFALNFCPSLRTIEPLAVKSLYGLVLTAASLVAALPFLKSSEKVLGATLSAVVASVGLGVSGMVKASKIENFLNVGLLILDPKHYDPTLMTVMGSGVIISWMAYQFVPGYSVILRREACMCTPVKHHEFNVPASSVIDWKLIGGSASFGVGWALACLCPGPAFFHLAAGTQHVMFVWFPTYLGGALLAENVANGWACFGGASTSAERLALVPET